MKIIHTTIKLVIVAIISALIAYFLGIKNFVLVGVIGLLSVSITKKDSIYNGIKRYLDVLFALALSTILYGVLGFEYYVLVLFLILFVLGSYLLKIDVGLVPSIVLANNVFFNQTFSLALFFEGILIITIGTGVALLISIIYPEKWNNVIKNNLNKLDQMIKDHLFMLSILLKQTGNKSIFLEHHKILNSEINKCIKEVETADKNIIFDNDHAYLIYTYMRKNQVDLINTMYKNIEKLNFFHNYQLLIGKYIEELIIDIGNDNKAKYQINKLNELRGQFKNFSLPQTREEFETRAILFGMLNDIENFLQVKIRFHENYPNFKI